MGINYFLSILDLYSVKETDSPLIIEVLNKNDTIKIDFSYESSYLNKTFVNLNKDVFFNNLKFIINKIQNNKDIISENLDENYYYKVELENKTRITFINFESNDLQMIRNKFNSTNLDFTLTELDLNVKEDKETYDEIYNENKNTNLRFSFGFSSFITIFLTAIWFLDIFMIALWIFKIIK